MIIVYGRITLYSEFSMCNMHPLCMEYAQTIDSQLNVLWFIVRLIVYTRGSSLLAAA